MLLKITTINNQAEVLIKYFFINEKKINENKTAVKFACIKSNDSIYKFNNFSNNIKRENILVRSEYHSNNTIQAKTTSKNISQYFSEKERNVGEL